MMPTYGISDSGEPLHAAELFGHECPLWLEIGIGAGEHLIWQAQHNPSVGLIGVEPFITGISSCLYGVETHALKNVRLCNGDGRVLLNRLPTASIDRVFILHPDPWPKWRHAKRRLIQPAFLDALARVMVPGGELRLGTDWPDYSTWALRHILAHGSFVWHAQNAEDWRRRPDDWPITRYAQKAQKQGRCDVHLGFSRV